MHPGLCQRDEPATRMQMPEDPLVARAFTTAAEFLEPPLIIRRGAPLLYAVIVDNTLQVTVNPRKPIRGQGAFETDLCVFEQRPDGAG